MELNTRDATMTLLLGAIVMQFAMVLVTAFRVPVAPPIDALPLSMVNLTWAAIALFLVRRDIWWGYFLAVLVGFSIAAFPVLIFFDLLGPRPVIVITHFLGLLTDLIIGFGLVVSGFRALMPPTDELEDDY